MLICILAYEFLEYRGLNIYLLVQLHTRVVSDLSSIKQSNRQLCLIFDIMNKLHSSIMSS